MMVSSNADTFERGDAPSAGFLLEVKGLTRTFGPVHALKNVSFSVRRGEVVGLIGENGAGKSTLLNIISGTDSADAGTLSIRGNTVTMRSYKEANSHGVFRVFQELALLPNMTVWENLFLGHESLFSRAGVLDRNAAIQHAREIMHEYGHDWIDVSARVGDLPFPAQQLVEILKAFALARLLGYDEPIVLLDEPTTSLSGEEVEFLHRLIDTVRQQSAMVFVSHRLPELIGWSDRIVIMKDGELVGEAAADALTEDELHYRMVGRERKGSFYREDRQREPNDVEVLRVQSLSDDKHFRDVSLSVREGEIVGVAGVLGSGKNLLGRAIFGGSKISSGIVEYKGKALSQDSPRTSVRKGIGYVSADRKLDGMIETFSVGQNITVGSYTTVGKPLVKRRSERRTAVELIARLRIKTKSHSSPITSLSGGNQQKALLARWLATGAELLILDNPTRGVDAGAKEEIYDVMRDLADNGVAILLISDDLLEIIGLSNRLVVMNSGVVTDTLPAAPEAKPSEAQLIARMV